MASQQAALQPGQPGFVPSRVQLEAFNRAFRRVLWPRTVYNEMRERHLRLNHWDVQAAIWSFLQEELEMLPPQSRPLNSLAGTIPPYLDDSAGPLRSTRDKIRSLIAAASLPAPTSSASTSNAPVSSTQKAVDDQYPPARLALLVRGMPRNPGNIEQERRDTARYLRETLVNRNQLRLKKLSISQAVLLMHLADWDIGQALGDWKNLDEALDRLHLHFDRMRSGEGTSPSSEVTINGKQERQSERLAILLAITTRPDWGSLQAFLADHRFDLVASIVDWYKAGIPVAPKPKKKAEGNKVCKDVFSNEIPLPNQQDVVAPNVDNLWAPERAFYRRVSEYTGGDDSIPPTPMREDDRDRAFGFLLHPDRHAPQPGNYHAESYFVTEAISKNRYFHKRFAQPAFKWPKIGAGYGNDNKPEEDVGDETKKVVFDFSNKDHVEKLSNWRRQDFSRTTGILTRTGAQHWQPVELAKLYKMVEAYYEEYISSHASPSDKPNWILPVSAGMLLQWTDALNEAFVGTRPGGGSAIRWERTSEGVGTQVRRTRPITEDFNIPEDKAWFAKKGAFHSHTEQRKLVLQGKDQLAEWDPEAERKKTSDATPAPATGKLGKQPLRVEDDTASDPNDSDATKERKAHTKRSRAVLVRQAEERRRKDAERRKQNAQDEPAVDDKEDVLSGPAFVSLVGEDAEEGNADDEQEEQEGPRSKTRKTPASGSDSTSK
ncbi:uncharacterized protein AB675_6328 [Cyphellophora attinorum]|uniref:Uncharacterized protein n=1 Tax=Cyphellophora attinorum TaxID=1664694 RepID=A0A0N0NQE4_9EURO|nr:uncharacterized protein AB675_6328 [Phialophora attinorum]KPI43811.1 hypothetical protein AB675_6328 [Phialophora attinorum]